jgi:hypothetical protein
MRNAGVSNCVVVSCYPSQQRCGRSRSLLALGDSGDVA